MNDSNQPARLSSSFAHVPRRLFGMQPDLDDDPDAHPSKGLSSFMAGCLTSNFISVGYLFVPWVFATAGLLLTTVAFLLVMLQSFITCTYVMEACARAELLASVDLNVDGSIEQSIENDRNKKGKDKQGSHGADSRQEPFNGTTIADLPNKIKDTMISSTAGLGVSLDPPVVVSENDASERERDKAQGEGTVRTYKIERKSDNWDEEAKENKTSDNTDDSQSRTFEKETEKETQCLPIIKERTYELPELSRIFMGEFWRVLFTITTCCDLYGLTWSVAAVFASSMASEFTIRQNDDDYVIFIAIFTAVVIPLAFVPIVDQVHVQIGFFMARMLMVLTMLLTTSAAFGSSTAHFGEIQGRQTTAPVANFRTLHLAIQVCIFSTAYQFSVPVMAGASEDKSSMRRIYGGSTGFIAGSVLILSLVLASYFGSDLMEPSSNLNWAVYHGGTGTFDEESGERLNIAWWAFLISKFVVLYPAIDGISTFVLCSVSLGSILMGAWYGKELHDLKDSWKRRVLFCLLGTVPQLLGATCVRDLSVIATYAGLFTVASYSICPCLLQIYSSRILKLGGLDPKTHYSTVFSNEISAWTVAILGFSMILYAIIGSQVISN